MKTVLLSSFAASALLFASTTANASDSSNISRNGGLTEAMDVVAEGRKGGSKMTRPHMGMQKPGIPHIGRPKPSITHIGGSRPNIPPMAHGPRPGMHGIPKGDVYRRPYRGYVMPRYWVQPSFYIPNYTIYGLSAPSRGYNWSRYYDDAVLTDTRGYVHDYRSGVNWNAGYTGEGAYYDQPDYGPSMQPDRQAYDWGDSGSVAFAAPDGSSYSYDGEWQGQYVDAQGNVFEGEWEGTVTRRPGVSGPGYPAPAPRPVGMQYPGDTPYGLSDERRSYSTDGLSDERRYSTDGLSDERRYSTANENYSVPRGYESYERCLKSNGLKGAAIGAILGGVAGNRIAGRGDRLGGSLVGAGLGGVFGAAIEKATDKCKQHHPRRDDYHRPYPPQGYPQQPQGWQGGYYYHPQAPMVTVTVVPGASLTTTTVTEEVYYETVKTYPRKKAARKLKPKPKPRCVCR